MEKIGKLFKYMNQDQIANYTDIHFDVLWYLLKLTKVNRCVSYESLREFLIRYLLITETDLNQSASEFIDNGILIDGTINNKYFSFHVKDLIHLMGFSYSDFKYNIRGSLEDFIQEYRFKSYSIKIEESTGDKENPHKISKDVLLLLTLKLKNLLDIETLSVSFKDRINQISDEELKKVLTFTNYVMKTIEMKVFEDYITTFPEVARNFEERFLKENVVCFNVYDDMERANLLKIYDQLLHKDVLQPSEELDLNDPDILIDYEILNTFITFAYGVKHNFIQLSDRVDSLHNDINYADFQIEYEHLLGDDGEIFTTKYIYDIWKMDKWIHLIP